MADKMKALGAYRPRIMKTWQVVFDPYPVSTMKELAPAGKRNTPKVRCIRRGGLFRSVLLAKRSSETVRITCVSVLL